jgi:hypothetical protein
MIVTLEMVLKKLKEIWYGGGIMLKQLMPKSLPFTRRNCLVIKL